MSHDAPNPESALILPKSGRRAPALLLALGASILLFRTLMLLFVEGGLSTLAWFTVTLTFAEMAMDLACLTLSLRWALQPRPGVAGPALRWGAAATITHFIRVLIFALGRIPALDNFDVQEAHRQGYAVDPFWVTFALVLAILGVLGAATIWLLIRRSKARNPRAVL